MKKEIVITKSQSKDGKTIVVTSQFNSEIHEYWILELKSIHQDLSKEELEKVLDNHYRK
jgi:hypothetical protein